MQAEEVVPSVPCILGTDETRGKSQCNNQRLASKEWGHLMLPVSNL